MSKRETREFISTYVTTNTINKILDAGRLAGSARNKQPWDFILINNKVALRNLAEFGKFTKPISNARFAVVIVIPNEYMQDRFDSGRAAQNMMLAAHSMGIGSCPITLHNETGARKHLGIPEILEIQVALAFGYPIPLKTNQKVKRKHLDEVLHMESWGKTSQVL